MTTETITAPAQSVAFGPGLTTAAAGTTASFTVQARDTYGNNMTTSDAVIAVSFVDDTGVSQNIAHTATQNTDNKGLFTVTYTPTQSLASRITVTLNGTPIKGSPFTVSVQVYFFPLFFLFLSFVRLTCYLIKI
jgi:plastocyanin